MTITIENINGKRYNVIWHDSKHDSLMGRRFVTLTNGVKEFFLDAHCLHYIATALPPLPRNPEHEHARLLHLYAAHGIEIWFEDAWNWFFKEWKRLLKFDEYALEEICAAGVTFSHATYSENNRVEIALED